jgi:hypothetical protein
MIDCMRTSVAKPIPAAGAFATVRRRAATGESGADPAPRSGTLTLAARQGMQNRCGPVLAITHREGTEKMLWTICIILLVLWALGMATAYTAGGLIHLLLLVAVAVLVFRLIQGRRLV